MWLIDPDDTFRHRLTDTPGYNEHSPRWSPDGRMIAFGRSDVTAKGTPAGPPKHSSLWVMNADGTGQRQVLPARYEFFDPSWAPNGELFFTGPGHPSYDGGGIWVVSIDGSNRRPYTVASPENETFQQYGVEWSESAQRVFLIERTNGVEHLLVSVRADGSDRRVHRRRSIVNQSGEFFHLRVSPSAAHAMWNILVGLGPDTRSELWLGDLAASHDRMLAAQPLGGHGFGPSGDRYVYGTGFGLVVADLSGRTIRGLGVHGQSPDWSWTLGRFADILGSPHEIAIDELATTGVVAGCATRRYCPRRPVTRGETATLIDRSIDLPLTDQDFFDDDAGTTHEAAINRLAAAGVMSGTGSRQFHPAVSLSRAQMASVLVRAFDIPASDRAVTFTDVDPRSTHARNIQALADSGLTRGCMPDKYCPSTPVLRDQMATFLSRALER